MELVYLWIDGYKNLKNFSIALNSAYEESINNNFKIELKEKPNRLNNSKKL